MKKRYLMSISGGRTSVMLSKLLIDREKLKEVENIIFVENDYSIRYYTYENETSEYIFVFANTSVEDERTLIFMDNSRKYWGLKSVWVEAVVNPIHNKGTTHRVINFNTAKRKGEVFEEVIKKYGIPNNAFKHCTRELKQQAIRSFLRSIEWGNWRDYKTILGYRADEPKRANIIKGEKLNQWYPLFEYGIRKPDVAFFWNRQPFDLGIIDAEGNCKICFKKSDLKVIYQQQSKPEAKQWIEQMENKYNTFVPESRDISVSKPPYYFFRDNRTLKDVIDKYPELKNLSIEEIRDMLKDKSLSEDGANYDLLEQEDCAESCEAFTEEEED